MPPSPPRIYRFDRFVLDAGRRQLLGEGQRVPLQPKTVDLLVALVESGGQVVSKDDLLQAVWSGQAVEESNLTVHVSILRKALGEQPGEHRFIATESGRGYRFVANVILAPTLEPTGGPENRNCSRPPPVSSAEWEDAQSHPPPPGDEIAPPSTNAPLSSARRLTAVVTLAASAALILVYATVDFRSFAPTSPPVREFKLSRLTNNGKVSAVALTSDGRYAAYVLGEGNGNSLWMQQIGTATAIRVLAPMRGEVWGLRFSPDGTYLYYTWFAGDRADVDLFRVPSLGGIPEQIPNISAPGFALSPDGTRIAHTNSHSAEGKTYLQVTDIDGPGRRQVAERQQPRNFEIRGQVISWSRSTDILAAVVTDYAADVPYSSLVGVTLADGSEQLLSPRRWYNVSSIEWMNDGTGLLVVAGDAPSAPPQVWALSYPPYPRGGVRRLTDDLSRYGWVGIASDGQTIATVQTNRGSSLWAGHTDRHLEAPREIASETGPLSPLVSLVNGSVVFRSETGGSSNLWAMAANGGRRRQLTTDARASYQGMCASPDGAHVVFSSWRAGKQNLWRLAVEGGALMQLTSGDGEAYPSCSPDGRWVAYQSGVGIGRPTIWRVPLGGGVPEPLVDTFSSKPAFSSDGSRLAYFYLTGERWRIGIVPTAGGRLLQDIDVPSGVTERLMRWSPDDRGLYYVSVVGNVGNLWILPLDGAPPRRVTRFLSHRLEDFVLDQHGALVLARSTEARDVVLLQSVR